MKKGKINPSINVGRLPVLVPVSWENGGPVFGDNGKIPDSFEVPPSRTGSAVLRSFHRMTFSESVPLGSDTLSVGIYADFDNMKDEAVLFYLENGERKQLGRIHKLFFKPNHFTGCRTGLFMYSTAAPGGYADFSDFRMNRT